MIFISKPSGILNFIKWKSNLRNSFLRSETQQSTDSFKKTAKIVPWTISNLLKFTPLDSASKFRKDESFATLLRNSPLMQIGDLSSPKLVIGVVIENIDNKDLYIDYGGKFLAVCDCPENRRYPRGSLVVIKLRDLELTERFMLNKKAITLRESDASFVGPYKGSLSPLSEAELAQFTDTKSLDDLDSGDRNSPPGFKEAVLKSSCNLPKGVSLEVKGYDFNKGIDYSEILDSFLTTGFQASHFADAIKVINELLDVRCKLTKEFPEEDRPCKIFLAYTSNMVSCGLRDVIRFLTQHNLVDVIVSTAGGIEEDIIKCIRPSYLGSFNAWSGESLRQNGINRIGNLLVPNENYVEFEKWLTPLLDQMLVEQKTNLISWTPSKVIDRLGKEIDNPDSIYYWCHKNKIPVFCPALTDGSLGDMMFSHSYKDSEGTGLRVDIVEDLRCINQLAIFSKCTGMIVLGGGVVKHHTFNANLMRNGSEYCVLVNTASEFDGSDAGASPDEGISWGKIRGTAKSIKIHGDASLIFPLLVGKTFASYYYSKKNDNTL